jgi:hypothetical protein
MGVCCTKQDLTQIEENSKIVIKNQLKENNFNNEKTFYSEKSKKIYNSGPILKLLMSQDNFMKTKNNSYNKKKTANE